MKKIPGVRLDNWLALLLLTAAFCDIPARVMKESYILKEVITDGFIMDDLPSKSVA